MIYKHPAYVFLVLAATVLAAPCAQAQQPAASAVVITAPDQLDLIGVGTVTDILKPDLIKLADGKSYRLDEIRVPVTYGGATEDFLRDALVGKKIGLYAAKKAKENVTDNYGNPLGQIVLEDGTWVQKEMVARGLAWAFGTDTNRMLVKELHKYEDVARLQKKGFWSEPEYGIKTKANIRKFVNSFQIYQGKIEHGISGTEAFILDCDFDAKKTPALTFTIPRNYITPFIMPGQRWFTTEPWSGAIVRLRGWVSRSESGQLTVQVTHPEQLEFIDPRTDMPTTLSPKGKPQ